MIYITPQYNTIKLTMNRKSVSKKRRASNKKRRIQTKKKRVARRTKKTVRGGKTQNREKISVVMSVDPFARIKQNIYDRVKHHIISSKENGEINGSDDNPYKKNTPLNIISNGVESSGDNGDMDVDDMLILAMPENTNKSVYKTPLIVKVQTIKNIIDPIHDDEHTRRYDDGDGGGKMKGVLTDTIDMRKYIFLNPSDLTQKELRKRYYKKGLIDSDESSAPMRTRTVSRYTRNNSKSADAAIGAFFIDREKSAEKYSLPLVFKTSETKTNVKT